MELPFSRWYPAISRRRSRRRFDSTRDIEVDVLAGLRTVCAEFRPFRHARAVLVTESPDKVFTGAVGPYGKVKDAPAFVAFIGNMSGRYVQEQVGYTGEGIILEATALQLDTCWVGGFFRPDVVASLTEIAEDERVLAVSPVGYAKADQPLEERVMTGFGRTRRRKPLSTLATGLKMTEWPEWVRVALEAARLAPSAINRQPWRFDVEPGNITVSVRSTGPEFGISKRLDCGIAMLHIEVAAMTCGVRGQWDFLQPSKVAQFTAQFKE